MALGYVVNWIEQGRNPIEIGDSGSYDVIGVDYRLAYSNGRYFRQTRTRRGVESWSRVETYCEVTYRAVTVSANGATTQITEAQSAEIMADAYTSGAKSCTTAREDGPNFSVTKVVRNSTPLATAGTASTEWEDWGAWVPALPASN